MGQARQKSAVPHARWVFVFRSQVGGIIQTRTAARRPVMGNPPLHGPYFEELDYRPTPIGVLSLRRRRELSLDVDVFEIKLGEEYLMSSLFTASEIALARLGLAELSGADLEVMVGGLGLGYTAQAVLEHEAVKSLVIVEALDAVIDWHEKGVLPLGPALTADPRSRFVLGDFFALAASMTGFDPDAPLDGLMRFWSTSTIRRAPFSLRRTRPFISPRDCRGSPHTFVPVASSGFGLTRFRTRRSLNGLLRSSPWRALHGLRFTIRFRTGSSPRPSPAAGVRPPGCRSYRAVALGVETDAAERPSVRDPD